MVSSWCLTVVVLLFHLSDATQTINHEGTETTFVWLTDIHLDVLYDPRISGKEWCRSKFNKTEWEAQQRFHSPTMQSSKRSPFGPVWSGGIGGQGAQRPMTNEMSPWISRKDRKQRLKEDGILTLPAYWGRFGCDAPSTLVQHCFGSVINTTLSHTMSRINEGAITNKPFIIVTGDLAAHYWEHDEKHLRWKSLDMLTSMLAELSRDLGAIYEKVVTSRSRLMFNEFYQNGDRTDLYHQQLNHHFYRYDSQLIMTVGNNDLPEDYIMEEYDPWAKDLYELWAPYIIPPINENQESFYRGMYYWTPVLSVPNLRALCLNTMWWSQSYVWTTERPRDPAGQLKWLKYQLADAQESGNEVIILGHIPPGCSYFTDRAFSAEPQWYADYEKKFLKLIGAYGSIIVGQFFGHFHSDDLRIQQYEPLKYSSSDQVDRTRTYRAQTDLPASENMNDWNEVDVPKNHMHYNMNYRATSTKMPEMYMDKGDELEDISIEQKPVSMNGDGIDQTKPREGWEFKDLLKQKHSGEGISENGSKTVDKDGRFTNNENGRKTTLSKMTTRINVKDFEKRNAKVDNYASYDEFVIADDNIASDAAAVGAALLAPSIGPTHGNNPGFRLMQLLTLKLKGGQNYSDAEGSNNDGESGGLNYPFIQEKEEQSTSINSANKHLENRPEKKVNRNDDGVATEDLTFGKSNDGFGVKKSSRKSFDKISNDDFATTRKLSDQESYDGTPNWWNVIAVFKRLFHINDGYSLQKEAKQDSHGCQDGNESLKSYWFRIVTAVKDYFLKYEKKKWKIDDGGYVGDRNEQFTKKPDPDEFDIKALVKRLFHKDHHKHRKHFLKDDNEDDFENRRTDWDFLHRNNHYDERGLSGAGGSIHEKNQYSHHYSNQLQHLHQNNDFHGMMSGKKDDARGQDSRQRVGSVYSQDSSHRSHAISMPSRSILTPSKSDFRQPLQYKSILTDYVQYVAYLHSSDPNDLGTYSPSIPPPFIKEYSFTEFYSQSDVMTNSIQGALFKIQNDSQLFEQFWNYHNTGGGQPAAFFLRCVQSVTAWPTMKDCMADLVDKADGTSEVPVGKMFTYSSNRVNHYNDA